MAFVYQILAMGWKYRLYNALPVLVFLLLGVPAALIYTGNAEPYVEASQMPLHPGAAFVGVILSVFATAILSGVLVSRSYAKTARSLGLSKEGGGLFGGSADFAGTMQGRPVRVDTRKVRRSTGAESSTTTTYTRVKAELDDPLEDGFMLIDDEGDSEPRATEDVPDEVKKVPVGDGFSVVGAANESRARDVLTPRATEALRVPGAPDAVVVGDPADAILDALPSEMNALGGLVGGESIEEKLREEIGGDAPTVSHEFKGLPLDATKLEDRIEAMITVADAVDAATFDDELAETPGTSSQR